MATEMAAESELEPRTFEDILTQLGGFGKFQVLILVLVLIMEIPTTFVTFVPIFHGVPPKSWLCNNLTVSAIDACTCTTEIIPNSDSINSIVAEWNLICDKVWVPDFITSMQMVGLFIGNFYAGTISDWYGRKLGLLSTIVLQALGQILSAVAPNVFIYGLARIFAGAGMSGYLTVSAIYAMEFLTPKCRPLCGSVGPWGAGIMTLALLAYLIRPWRILTYSLTAPYLLILIIYPLLSESPRWLIGQKKIIEAHKVIQYMAKMNGKQEISIELLTKIAARENPSTTSEINVKKYSYIDFFREKSLRKSTFCFMSLWMSWALTYFGISYNIRNLKGDLYMNVLYSGVSDAFGYMAPLSTFNRLGRRKSLVLYLVLTAGFLVALAIFEISVGGISYPTVTLTLLFLGKFSVGGVRSCIRCILGETYPTPVRAMGSALGGTAVGIGAIFAPQLAFLGSYWPSVPYFIFAWTSLAGVGASFLLQETNGKALQEELKSSKRSTIDIIIRRSSHQSQNLKPPQLQPTT